MIFNSKLKDSSFRLLCALDALPESNWKTNQSWLAKELGWGREKVAAAIANLEETGYLRRIQNRENGRFAHYNYEFHWEPIFKDNPNIQEDKYPGEDDDPGDGESGSGSDGGKPVTCTDGGKPGTEESGTTGILDRQGLIINNKSIEEPPTPEPLKSEKKEQGLVGGLHQESNIYQCLQKIDIPQKDKIRLTKQFSEDVIIKAVAHCTKPSFKAKTTLDASIFYFSKNPSHVIETKEELEAKKLKEEDAKRDRAFNRKKAAEFVVKHFWNKAKEIGVFIRECTDYLEISNDRIKEKLYYSDEKFGILLNHFLSKVGLEIPDSLRGIA